MRRLVFESLKTFNTKTRIHSYYNYISPDKYKKLFAEIKNEKIGIVG
ncbi:hypothetical protein Awo_c06510 [Acetobacterium woodii DSM 1030]|uniref:Transposase n=1 Tax=Acetobacterium woodii (strain ATCC 29683 / DSM 1030 / JCM 2381 / KCTC 1655 / WB1) TaxID=931626 RepID=H6LJP4_ACEWD|nr:hypothetical protein Awo_c06510 [Acetobacterium woodii DSM 1030]